MDIVFDVFVLDSDYVNKVSIDEDIYYRELKEFIIQRLKPLEDDINLEEKLKNIEDNEEFACIMVETLRTDGKFIRFHKYSEPLRKKMLDSFTPEDFLYINNKISELMSKRNN